MLQAPVDAYWSMEVVLSGHLLHQQRRSRRKEGHWDWACVVGRERRREKKTERGKKKTEEGKRPRETLMFILSGP